MILCCMDYLRNTVIGNIQNNSLRDILNGDLYKNIVGNKEQNIIAPSN